MLPERIAIVGGGLPGWLAAELLHRTFARADVAISVIECDPGPQGAETLSPAGIDLALTLGIDEDRILAEGGGAHILGTVIDRAGQAPGFVSFSAAGAPFGPVPFHHVARRLRQAGDDARLANYCLNALCAQSARYAPPAIDEQSVAASLEHGISIDAPAWSAALRQRATRSGVAAVTASEVALVQDDKAPLVRLSSGSDIAADLIIDVRTGAAAPLATPANVPPLYVHLEQRSDRLLRHVPLANGGRTMERLPFEAAAGQSAWCGGIVDLGLAWRVVDPMAGLGLQLLLSMLHRLLGLLPQCSGSSVEMREYNRLTASELAAAQDYAAQLLGQTEAESPALGCKRALYADCGRVAMFDEEPVSEVDWINVFDARGLEPRDADPQLSAVPIDALRTHAERLRAIMIAGLRAMPVYAGPAGEGR